MFKNANIFKADPTWLEPTQGGAGTCYFVQACSGVAEFPDLIKKALITQSFNQ
jgi:hypothetical protein